MPSLPSARLRVILRADCRRLRTHWSRERTAVIKVDQNGFLVIVAASALAGLVVAYAGKRAFAPVVVVEIIFGIIVGPQVTGWIAPDEFINFFSELGLGLLFFFVGYEMDFDRIRGVPLKLATVGWLMSLALAYAAGGLLASLGVVLSFLYVGSAISTTALGTLLPILSDAGDTRSRFGTLLMGAGSVGEFGPIILATVVLSTAAPLTGALLLIGFAAIGVIVGAIAVIGSRRGIERINDAMEKSSQAAIRATMLLVFALVTLATELTIDALLGGFMAGIIIRLMFGDGGLDAFESKLRAVGYGLFIPFFFVVTGMKFDLDSLTASAGAMLKLPLFLLLFLIVRGAPALVLYAKELGLRDRFALAFYSATQLPLVVAITTIAVASGRMRPSTSAALVGAGMLSVLIFPIVGTRLRATSLAIERGELQEG